MRVTVDVKAGLETRGRWLVDLDESGAEPLFTFRDDPDAPDELPDPERAFTPHREWYFTQSRDGIPLHERYDVFEVSDSLCRVADAQDALAFLRKYGPLGSYRDSNPLPMSAITRTRDDHKAAVLGTQKYSYAVSEKLTIEETSDFLRSALQTRPPVMHLQYREELTGFIICKDVVQALRTAALLSKSDGATWKECRRERCGAMFKVKGQRNTYCSTKCAQQQATHAFMRRKKQQQATA